MLRLLALALVLASCLISSPQAHAKHFADQGQAYAECQLVGQLHLQRWSYYSNPRCIGYPAHQCGGNPCYLCVVDNVRAQHYNGQCNSLQLSGYHATNTYAAGKTCATRPDKPADPASVSGVLRCDAGCEIAATSSGLLKPSGKICSNPQLLVEPGKNNCCGQTGGGT